MHAAIIDILSDKGQFKPEQALAVAEAIDMAIERAQLVTVPILDSRLAKVDARFDTLEAKMEARFVASEAKMDARFVASEAKMDARFAASEAKMDARFAASEAKMGAQFASPEAQVSARFETFESKLDRARVEIIIAVVVAPVAFGPFGAAVVNAVRRALF